MEVFVARHPIFDAEKDVYGYELVFRSGFEEYYEAMAADRAEADFTAFVDFGELTDGRKGLINFSRELLLMEFPVLFDREAMIAAIPGDMPPDEQTLSRCRDLRQFGYTLAINDLFPRQLDSPLLDLVDIARVNFTGLGAEERADVCRTLEAKDVRTVAQGVEAVEDFDEARSAGYSYFQGGFFHKPVIRPGREIPANKLTYMQLMREVNNAALSYDEVASLIERDVGLTYKLLRFMNSAWFGLRYEIHSVKHALVLLGPHEIKRWVALVAIKGAADDKPHELLLRALTRAKACEQIGLLAGLKKEAPEMFLTGMFSVIDALTDMPMAEALADLPLRDEMRSALLGGGNGSFRSVHDTVLSYEAGDWDTFSTSAAALRIDETQVPELFKQSLKWGKQALVEID